MELCITRTFSNLSHNTLFTQTNTHLQWKTSLPFKQTSVSRLNTGLRYYRDSYFKSLRSKISEETSTEASKIVKEEADGAVPVVEVQSFEKNDYEKIESDNKEVQSVEKNDYEKIESDNKEIQSFEKNDYEKIESDNKDSSVDGQMKPFEFLDNLNLELDFEKDSYLILLYGGGSLFALWLVSAVVGAIDSIPLFPKLMEIVGLSYTLWFATRYLLFKENREELFAKIEEIKEEVIGSGDD